MIFSRKTCYGITNILILNFNNKTIDILTVFGGRQQFIVSKQSYNELMKHREY